MQGFAALLVAVVVKRTPLLLIEAVGAVVVAAAWTAVALKPSPSLVRLVLMDVSGLNAILAVVAASKGYLMSCPLCK